MKYLITFDADGQHDHKDINKIITKLIQGYHIVVGKRDMQGSLKEFVDFCTNLLYGFSDPLCGLKGYNSLVYKSLGYFDEKIIWDRVINLSFLKKFKIKS